MVSSIFSQVGYHREMPLNAEYHKEIVAPNVILNVVVSLMSLLLILRVPLSYHIIKLSELVMIQYRAIELN